MLLLVSWAADNRPVFFFKDVFHSSRRTPEEGCRSWLGAFLKFCDDMCPWPSFAGAAGCSESVRLLAGLICVMVLALIVFNFSGG